MANGKKQQGWYPANDVEGEKAAQGDVYQGQDGEYYQHENMPKASPKNPPAPAPEPVADDSKKPETGPGAPQASTYPPSAADLETAPKPAAVAPPAAPSFMKPAPVAPRNVDYDADNLDSTPAHNPKDGSLIAPRGVNRPPDVMSEQEKADVADKQEAKRRVGMAVTHSVDSVGKPKGEFKTTPQGNDQHGMRIPDKVDYSNVVEAHNPVVGPRGAGAPKDTFHKV